MQVFARMRHRDLSRLGRVLEVTVATRRPDEAPPFGYKHPNDLA
jgi:hypothetical protein